MSDYVPTTAETRSAVMAAALPDRSLAVEAGLAFDRWLVAHDVEVRKETLEEAAAYIETGTIDPDWIVVPAWLEPLWRNVYEVAAAIRVLAERNS